MAIFHLAHHFVRRSEGASSVAKAAYNSGKKLEDPQGSTEHSDYTRKGGVLFDEISLPGGSPAWANNRGELWRRLEAREDKSTRRADAILAHSFDIALPHELTLEQNIFLARDFVREQFTRKGYAVDWAIHAADPRGDQRNIHLHILVPLRKIDGESFGKKDRYTRGRLTQQVKTWRSSWRNLANRHLKRYGHLEQIDERTLRAQGIKRLPTRHHGVRAKAKRKILDRLRPLQPKAPIVRTTQRIGKDGSVRVRQVIARSGLNGIAFSSVSNLLPIGRDRMGTKLSSTKPVGHVAASDEGKSFSLATTASSIGHTVKQIAADGTITMRVKVPEAELYGKAGHQSAPVPLQPTRKGWPPAAIRDWALWGHKNPAKFFALWPELSVGGGGLQL